MNKKVTIVTPMKLFDDASTHEKHKVMDKLDIMNDDERNPIVDYTEMNDFIEFGKSYKFTVTVEEIKE